MTGPIHYHIQLLVREGELDDFLDAARRYVEVTKTEPGSLEGGAFVDRDTRHAAWVLTFKDADALLAHANHPGVKALGPELMPRIEALERVEMFGDVPEAVFQHFVELGFNPSWMPEHASFVTVGT